MRLLSKNALSLSLFALLAFAVSSSAQTPPAVPRKTPAKAPPQAPVRVAAKPAALVVPRLKFEKYKLENGLEVIFSEDHRLPMVAVNLWYHVGPANELPAAQGSRTCSNT